ncbi:MAG: formate/nitrite transporter family protein [Pseudomonadota bacterium]
MYTPTISHFSGISADKVTSMDSSIMGFFVGAAMAGAYIGIAMILALSVGVGVDAGVRPLVMGAVFGIGLILTIFAGSELFTGYVLYMGTGLATKKVSWLDAGRIMTLVWFGNLAGAALLSIIFAIGGGGWIFANDGEVFLDYANRKMEADAVALLAKGVLCNWLVCLAIWTAARVEGDAAKCIVVSWILMAFVAAGFEHSVANMTVVSLGLLAPGTTLGITGAGHNLFWVTIGNLIGGGIFVVGGYLAATRTDPSGQPRHDCGKLPEMPAAGGEAVSGSVR